jgi:hypothetical protein
VEWGKKKLTAEELNNNLLLAQDKWGQTAWLYASLRGKEKYYRNCRNVVKRH